MERIQLLEQASSSAVDTNETGQRARLKTGHDGKAKKWRQLSLIKVCLYDLCFSKQTNTHICWDIC